MTQNVGRAQQGTKPNLLGDVFSMGYYTAIHKAWSKLGNTQEHYDDFKHWIDGQVQKSCVGEYI